jgi:hypothetical protein
VASEDATPSEIIDQILSGKKTLQGRLTRMQKALKAWDEIGGLPRAIRKTEIVEEGLAEFRGLLEEAIAGLEAALEEHRRTHQEDLYHALESYALEHDLRFEGELVSDPNEPIELTLGDYRVQLEPGEPAEVRFVKSTVGSIAVVDPDEVAEVIDEIRGRVETRTENFLNRLKQACFSVAGSQGGKAALGRVLKYFIADLQPELFWEQADPEHLRPYSHVNFAWELLRESRRDTPPFQVSEATVHANVSAAGGQGERGDALFLMIDGRNRSRLYSHIQWTGGSEVS